MEFIAKINAWSFHQSWEKTNWKWQVRFYATHQELDAPKYLALGNILYNTCFFIILRRVLKWYFTWYCEWLDIQEHFSMSNLSKMLSRYFGWDNDSVPRLQFHYACIARKWANGPRCLIRKWCCSSFIISSVSFSKVPTTSQSSTCTRKIMKTYVFFRLVVL